MTKITDQDYLLNDQYRDSSKLDVRMALHKRFGDDSWHQWVFDQFDLPADARVLELGCGPGALWLKNLERVPSGWSFVLSDLSPGMVDKSRRNLEGDGRFAFAQFDAQNIPYPDATFDAVIANHMLYHVPDRPTAYREINRVLRPEGRFYAATNGRGHMRQISELGRAVGIESSLRTFTVANDGFKLEDGEVDLPLWFRDVELRRRNETMAVTEAQPLVDYILSGANSAELTAEMLDRLKAAIDDEIATHGAYRIDKVSGLFVACPV